MAATEIKKISEFPAGNITDDTVLIGENAGSGESITGKQIKNFIGASTVVAPVPRKAPVRWKKLSGTSAHYVSFLNNRFWFSEMNSGKVAFNTGMDDDSLIITAGSTPMKSNVIDMAYCAGTHVALCKGSLMTEMAAKSRDLENWSFIKESYMDARTAFVIGVEREEYTEFKTDSQTYKVNKYFMFGAGKTITITNFNCSKVLEIDLSSVMWPSGELTGIATDGNGTFVVISKSTGCALYSVDYGATWKHTDLTSYNFYGVTYNRKEKKFVIVGNNGFTDEILNIFIFDPEEKKWYKPDNNFANLYISGTFAKTSVSYDGNRTVAVGGDNKIIYSYDLDDWATVVGTCEGTEKTFSGVFSDGKGKLFAVADDGCYVCED